MALSNATGAFASGTGDRGCPKFATLCCKLSFLVNGCLVKTRIWLGTFETAEDAAKAYDEAARIMCVPNARTNFSYGSNEPQSSSSKLLSDTLMAKLQKCIAKSQMVSKRPALDKLSEEEKEDKCLVKRIRSHKKKNDDDNDKGENNFVREFKPLEEDHIEEMIEELLDHGSIELRSVIENSSSI